jgi:hypothetical protein
VITAEQDGWPTLRRTVLLRDGGCVGAQHGDPRPCRDRFGLHDYDDLDRLQLDHVNLFSTKGRKPPHAEAFLVSQCELHHATWATAHRDDARAYLAKRYPEAWAAWLAR